MKHLKDRVRASVYVNGCSMGTDSNDGENNTVHGFGAQQSPECNGEKNLSVGYRSGQKIKTNVKGNHAADGDCTFGYDSGKETLNSANNIFMGYRAGYKNENCTDNIIIGHDSGYNIANLHRNVIIGRNTLKNAIGPSSYPLGSDDNIFIGTNAGTVQSKRVVVHDDINDEYHYDDIADLTEEIQNVDLKNNIFIGKNAGSGSTTVENAIAIGTDAQAGSNSVTIGFLKFSASSIGPIDADKKAEILAAISDPIQKAEYENILNNFPGLTMQIGDQTVFLVGVVIPS